LYTKITKIESYIPYTRLPEHLQLKDTDHVYLVSDISRLMLQAIQQEGKFKPLELIDSFRKCLSNGVLFIPGFVNTLHSGNTVQMPTLKPETGGLSKEAFTQYKKGNCYRTNDPFHSFFVFGKNGMEVVNSTLQNRDTFGADSVFAYLHRQGGILLIVDLELYYGFTFAHYVEQQKKVPYRVHTPYTFQFTDVNGKFSEEVFNVYAKKKGYIPTLNGLGEPLKKQGAMEIFQFNGIPIYKIDLKKAFDVLESDILHNKARNLINFNLSLYLKQTIKSITR
jgi:aminoglycoside N3'-acetyltransferase